MGLGRLVLFLGILTTLVAGLAWYAGWRLIPAGWPPAARGAAWGFVGAVVVVQPLAFALRIATGKEREILSWAAYVAMGFLLLTVTFTLLRDLGWLGARVAGFLPVDAERRRALLEMTNVGVLALAGGAFAVGVVRATARPTVVTINVPIVGLAPALDGFTIAQISDIHMGPTIKRAFLEDVVATVNALDADLVAVTGDVVDGSVAELRDQTAPLADLKARHGAWFITGNHEYYSGALEWIDEMKRLGMTALIDEHRVIDHDGAAMVVAGVTDHSAPSMIPAHTSDPHKAVAGAPVDAFKLLLAHQPRSAYAAQKAGFQLQLTGHTHGGQFFPGTLLVRLVQPFVEGLHQLEGMWVYTNRGTGYWGPPLRHTSITSEVTKLVLVKA